MRRPAEPRELVTEPAAQHEEAAMHIRPVSAALFLVAAMSSSAADSAPTQPQVVGGATAASVSVEGKTTQVTQIAPRAVINWRTFNLADGETVAFAQPGASAILLNRVTGAKSTIDGTITANGRIFIVNTRGIVFGRNAQVNTGSLVAMTADIDPAKFLEGDPAFRIASPASSSILNQGKLTAETGGNVMLLAPGVVNQGTITAKDGHVVLAT